MAARLEARRAGLPQPRATPWVLAGAAVLLLAAAPPDEPAPDDLVRRANAAYLADDRETADRLYALAEERTADPGLVAFNRAAVAFARDEFRDAEVLYARVLDDAACPPDRAARAWYNRGTCLLRRGGSAAVFRSAIACFERSLDSAAADEPLRADARHNLELAKVRWQEARKKDAKAAPPNADPPPEDPRHDPPPPQPGAGPEQPGPAEPGGKDGPRGPKTVAQQVPAANPPAAPNGPGSPAPGSSNPVPLNDDEAVQPLSPEDTREHLRRAAERLRKDVRDLRRTMSPPDVPGNLDW
jgi:tetratricopeptide (TPR) repeat protein